MVAIVVTLTLLLTGSTSASPWVWPLDPAPAVLRGFDPPPEPWLAGHRGVDLTARLGQEVRAAGAGVVSFAGLVGGRPVVSVSHGALRTTYEPVDPAVVAGDQVKAGAIIGTISPTASHCGIGRPCLHWGVRRGEDYLDPLSLLGRAMIRLLPVWDHQRTAARQDVDPASDPDGSSGRAVALTAGTLIAFGALALAGQRRRV